MISVCVFVLCVGIPWPLLKRALTLSLSILSAYRHTYICPFDCQLNERECKRMGDAEMRVLRCYSPLLPFQACFALYDRLPCSSE